MPDFYRVRDKSTGAEYNSPFLADGLEQIKDGKEDAATHDVYGNPFPPVYPEAKSEPKATPKEAQK